MQIIENWSDINGIVRLSQPSPNVSGFVEVELLVEKVNPMEGSANLLGDMEGKSLVVHVPEDLFKSLDINPGDRVVCRVRRANLDQTFVHRNHISVLHSI